MCRADHIEKQSGRMLHQDGGGEDSLHCVGRRHFAGYGGSTVNALSLGFGGQHGASSGACFCKPDLNKSG